jgi:hypothetical protein
MDRPNPDVDAAVAELSEALDRLGHKCGRRGYEIGDCAKAVVDMFIVGFLRGQRERVEEQFGHTAAVD